MAASHGTGIHRAGGFKRIQQKVGLRKLDVFEPGSSTPITFGSLQHGCEPLRLAKGIAAFEQGDDGVRAQFERAADIAVLARSHHCEIATVVRDAQALAHGLDQPHAKHLVTMMARPFLRGCHALAKIVHERG